MLIFFAGTTVGGFAMWFLVRRAARFANAQQRGAERMRSQLVDFCDKNNIAIRPWDVPPFELVEPKQSDAL